MIQPWVLYRFRDGGAEVMLVWRNRLSLFVVLLLLLVELFSPSRVSMTLLLTFASVTAVAAWWAWHM
ncbi:MAG: hypothetical protein KAX26_12895, partial [Anaerolineae bacterium]|nr:hypothetical protein [Anaerolineae bacterium]